MRWSWMLGSAVGLSLGLVAGASCGSSVFACGGDSECQDGTVAGECVSGFCAFPDEDCESGFEYGAHAGRLSGTCVPADAETLDAGTGTDATVGSASVDPATSQGPGPDDTTDPTAGPTADDSEGSPTGDVEFTDDELSGEFELGTFEDTQWSDDRVGLGAAAASGTFTSRVFDAGAVAQWQTVHWQPDGPYGKPLPDAEAAEFGYASDGVDMSGSVLLMHFDGRGVWGDGIEVPDASGAGSHGTLISDGGPVELVDGIFGTAIDDHLASRISIPTAQAPGLAFGEGDFSWSLWFRMDDPCEQNHVYMGVDNAEGTDYGPHLWLGCTDDPWEACPGMVGAPRAGGVLKSEHSTQDDGVFFCSSSDVDGDQWHHVVATKSGHGNAVARLYLDGQLEYQGGGSFAGIIEYPDEPDFTLGGFSRGTYPAEVVLDEAAIWTRALSDQEVAAVYRRGSLRLSVALRTCAEPDCADEPPFGDAMVDPPQVLEPGSELSLGGLAPGRYVQYRLQMSRRGDADPSPRLGSITVRGVL